VGEGGFKGKVRVGGFGRSWMGEKSRGVKGLEDAGGFGGETDKQGGPKKTWVVWGPIP